MSSSTLDIASVRAAFPALSGNQPYIFADNAGGSQCLKSVADAVTDYLLNTNVQLGADYSVSKTSTQRVASASEAAKEFFNAESADEIIFGSSSTQVAENLARALEDDFQEGDEIIITPEHEANSGPWKKLAKRKGLTLKTWRPTPTDPSNPVSIALKKDDLLPLITSRTRLIAFTACSNILGSVVPVEEVVRAARAKGQEVNVRKLEFSIDCVAYAPHRLINVRKWDVEYCFFSMYKVYGTHSAILYAKAAALSSSVSPLSHHFLSVSAPGSAKGYKLAAPSGPCYELAYSCRPVLDYLKSLTPSGTLADAEKAIAKQEHALLEIVLGFLTAPEQKSRGVQIVGSSTNDESRVPTVSFIVRGNRPMKSKDVVAHLDKATGVGIRYGHFYAYTLVQELQGMEDVEDGVVRVSLVHYNTIEEAQRIVELLKEALA